MIPRYQERIGGWLQIFWSELRFALRMLLKTPGFTLTAILTLALGIGVNLTLFALLNEELMRPRDVMRPDQIWAILPSDTSGEPRFFNTSRSYYDAVRKDRRAFTDVIGYSTLHLNLRTSEGWEEMRCALVSGQFFSFLGVPPVLGRGFLPEEDDKPGTHSVAVISYRFWQNYFHADTNVLGKTVSLDNQIVEIVGVAPPGFKGISLYQTDFWLPTSMQPLFEVYPAYSLVGRLKEGVSPKQAADTLAPTIQETTKTLLALGHPVYTNNISKFCRVVLKREGYGTLPAEWVWEGRKELARAGTLVGIATLLVLVIAGGNLANLLLARGLQRRKEMATRLALGASRWVLMRQFMLEGVLLAGLGTGVALLVLIWLGNNVIGLMPGVVYANADLNMHLDIRVLGFALFGALCVGAGFTLLPALQATRIDPLKALKDIDGGLVIGSRHLSSRVLLMVAQVALALVLLSGTGLCLGAITKQLQIKVGFPAQTIAVAAVHLERFGFTAEAAPAVVEEIQRKFSELPGVDAVGFLDMLPLIGERGHLVTDRLEGYDIPHGRSIEFGFRALGPGCLRALGIPLREGRDISQSDWSANRPVALVNESFARTFWPNQAILGKRIERLHRNFEIVGVVADARLNTLSQPPEPTVFFAIDRSQLQDVSFIIHTDKEPDLLLQPILNSLATIHPGLRKSLVVTLRESMRNQLRQQRQAMTLLGRLGGVALALTVLGVYGMMSYLVRQRSREVGIRLAIGAQRGAIANLILRSGAGLGLAGILVGLPLAWLGSFLLRHAIFGVSPFDLSAFLLAALLVLFSVLMACAVPAFRATRVDPMTVLRQE